MYEVIICISGKVTSKYKYTLTKYMYDFTPNSRSSFTILNLINFRILITDIYVLSHIKCGLFSIVRI